MKLTIFLLLISLLTATAASTYSQSARINLRMKDASLVDIFREIERKSDFGFFFKSEDMDMNKQISIDLQNASIGEIMEKILINNYSYRIIDKNIIITKANTTGVQQQKSVTGRVTDSSGGTLPGVSVAIKGTSNGTITDMDGNYSLSNVPENGTLVFSFVGMRTQEISIAGKTAINVILKEESIGIEEVVAVGYGTQSKKSLTTSISKMEAKDINIQPVGVVGNTLQGLAPGVQVQAGRGGAPGATPVIRVRGIGSIGGSNEALFVVDGFPLQSSDGLNQINPSDIESIEILKDAASAAIYGSRAANGVVIVTTKRGKSGKAKFEFNAYTGIQNVANRLDMMNKDEFIAHVKKVAGIRNVPYPTILDDASKLPDTDWQDQIFRTGKVSDYQLRATGGTDNLKYLISGGYYNEDGTLKGTDYFRYNFRFNLDADLSKSLKISVTMAPTYSQQMVMPSTGQWNNTLDGGMGRTLPNVMQCAYLMPSIINIKTANGDWGQPNAEAATSQYGFFQSNLYNPLAVVESVTNRFKRFSFFGNSYLEWSVLKDLKLKTSFGSTYNYIGQNGYIPANVPTASSSNANISTPDFNNIWAIEGARNNIDWLWENTLNYRWQLGKNGQHNFNFLGMASAQRFNEKLIKSNGKVGTYSNSTIKNPTASTDIQGSVAYDDNAFISFGGRLSYDFARKYYLTVALRNDGSSKFGLNKRFSYFPSLSAAWRISDESFMKNLSSYMNDLKLRVSYGETGNANIGSFTWANSIIASNYFYGGIRTSGSIQSGLDNPNLTWEKNKQVNIGLDMSFFNNKITIATDYYIRRTNGMLMNKDLAGIYGYATTTKQNVGSMENRGLELTLSTNFKIGQVNYTADYNFSTNSNKVLSLGGPNSLPSTTPIYGWGNMYQVVVGQPIGNINGFIVEGIFKNAEDLAKYPQWNGNGNIVGDWRIKDVSQDGKITEEDRTKLGNAIPKYTFSTTQRFAYKGFDLTLMLQGVAKVSLLAGDYRQLYYGVTGLGGNMNAPADVINNFFDPANPTRDVKYHRIGGNTGVTMNNQATNYSVLDASYLRLRNITLGYAIPQNIVSKAKLSNARIFISCQNLFTITKYPGVNPEANNANNGNPDNTLDSAFTPGVDQGTYPAVRTVTFGINLGL